MSDCRKCAELDWCVENEDCGFFKPKPLTNADRIRAMTDEELAEFFEGWFSCGIMRHSCFANTKDCSMDCKGAWLDWLQQEVKD